MATAVYKEEVFKTGRITNIEAISDVYFKIPGRGKVVAIQSKSIGQFSQWQQNQTLAYCETVGIRSALGPGTSVYVNIGMQIAGAPLASSVYKLVSEVGKADQIRRNTLVTGSEETVYITKFNVSEEVGIIVELAEEVFRGKVYQAQLDLVADPEAEQWETLLFRFYIKATSEEFLKYQKELVKKFVSAIAPGKRNHFSLSIEAV